MKYKYLLFLAFFSLFLTNNLFAQEKKGALIIKLNRQGIEAYQNLEFNKARDLLTQALTLCQTYQIKGMLLAQTHLNLGSIYILAFKDEEKGEYHFNEALKIEPDLKLDPVIANPHVEAIFDRIKNKILSSAEPTLPPTPLPTPPKPTPTSIETKNFIHFPCKQQIPNTSIPVYVEIKRLKEIGKVILYYRGAEMTRYLPLYMNPYQRGYAAKIPQEVVLPDYVFYYIIVQDKRDIPRIFIGGPRSPYIVSIRETLSEPPCSLPGMPPERRQELPLEQRRGAIKESLKIKGEIYPRPDQVGIYLSLGLGGGAGVPTGKSRKDNVKVDEPGLGDSGVIINLEGGYFPLSFLSVGAFLRLACLPSEARSYLLALEGKYLFAYASPKRGYLSFGLGTGVIMHRVNLGGGRGRYKSSGKGAFLLGGGFIYDFTKLISFKISGNLAILFPTVGINLDIILGPYINF